MTNPFGHVTLLLVMADDYRRQGFELERRIFELDIKCSSLKSEKPGMGVYVVRACCFVAFFALSLHQQRPFQFISH